MTDQERFEKAKEECVINNYIDDSFWLQNSVNQWNAQMKEGRRVREKMRSIPRIFLGVNLFFMIVVAVLVTATSVFKLTLGNVVWMFIAYTLYSLVAIYCMGAEKNRFELCTLCGLLLLTVNWFAFLMLFLINIVFCIFYHEKFMVYETLPGYPHFMTIYVRQVKRCKDDLPEEYGND